MSNHHPTHRKSNGRPPSDDDKKRHVPLTRLRSGQRGRVELSEQCEDCDLLCALGLTHQCRLKVCKAGAPCIVQIGATRLGLAPAIAQNISVIPD